MAKPFRIGAVSIGPAGRDPAPLLAEAEAGIRRAAAAGAGLVVLPELFAMPYVAAADPAEWAGLGEPLDGPTVAWAKALAVETETAILFGLALSRPGGRPYNAAVIVAPDQPTEVAALKIHFPPKGRDRFGEADHFAPGPAETLCLPVGRIVVGPLICYDRRFPECWRAAAADAADVVAVLVAGPASADPPGFYRGELATHARSNAVYAIAAARTGTETVTGREVRHDGETAAIDPDGAVVAATSKAGDIVLLDIDPARLKAARASNPTAERLRLGPSRDNRR